MITLRKKTESTFEKSSFMMLSMLIIALTLAGTVLALNFSSSPSINGGNATAYTTENIVCSWTESADTTITNVTWYRNGTQIFSELPLGTSSTVLSGNTSKNQLWLCNVTIYNATNVTSQTSNITIINTLPSAPILYNLSDYNMGSDVDLTEDHTYNFFLNATDADGDTITYSSDAGSFCNMNVTNAGNITCTPTNADLSDPHTITTTQVIFNDKDGGQGTGNNLIVSFNVIPVNDQANFSTVPGNTSINADTPWNYTISGLDEELDYPLIFSLSSDLNTAHPETLFVNATNSTYAKIQFNTTNGAPSNADAGNWTVELNLTDVNGSNSTRLPDMYSFNLIINTTNHNPEITSNISELPNGTQNFEYTFTIYGNDSDSNNSLSWNISAPWNASTYCLSNFPWDITTTDNSSTNSSGEVNLTLTNDFVACRYVNITLRDNSFGSDSVLTTLNITNVNDAPQIYDVGTNGNISNQSTYLYSNFEYAVNASDPDALTYDINNTGILTYYVNDTNFAINSSGSLYAHLTNESFIGNMTLNITVSDGQYNVSKIMALEIFNNTPPTLNLSYNNLSFLQNQSIEVNFSAIEPNNETMSLVLQSLTNFNVSIYNITTVLNNYSGGENYQVWLLNLTRTDARLQNDLVGKHLLNITVKDSRNSSGVNESTGILNITINNTNDAPFFDENQDNVSDSISFGTIVYGVTHTQTIYATDFDLFLSPNITQENLTFGYENASSGIQSISFTKSSSNSSNNSAILSFYPSVSGAQSIILKVTDADNVTEYQNVSFTTLQSSAAPVVKQIKPFYNDSTTQTTDTFVNASSYYPALVENITFSENTTMIYDAIIENDSTITNNTLTYDWYINGVLNKTITAANPGVNSNLTINYSFWSAGQYNITLKATDSRLSYVNFTWHVNVTNLNRPPIFNIGSMEDLTVNLSSEFINYFSYRNLKQRFYDADEDLNSNGKRWVDENETTSLNYSVINPELCTLAAFTTSGDDLRINPISTGSCTIKFRAVDPYGAEAISDFIQIDVVGAEPASGTSVPSAQTGGSSTRTQVITVPIKHEVDKPKPIKIISPGTVNTYANRTIKIPITLKNTWTDPLRGVVLNLTMAYQPNVTYNFENAYFPAIGKGAEVSTVLSISNYRTDGPFEITVFATVGDPKFTDSVDILINSMEQTSEGDQIQTKVTFANDMLSENPECRELNDLLDRAQLALQHQNYKESLNMVDAVINGCKFLLNQKDLVRKETPGIIEKSFNFLDQNSDKLFIGAGLLTILTIVFYLIASIKKIISELK